MSTNPVKSGHGDLGFVVCLFQLLLFKSLIEEFSYFSNLVNRLAFSMANDNCAYVAM